MSGKAVKEDAAKAETAGGEAAAQAPPRCQVCHERPAEWRIGPTDDSGECMECGAQPVTRETKVCSLDCPQAWWDVTERGYPFVEADDECGECG